MDYTIVGAYPDQASFVEFVEATDPDHAVKETEALRGPDDPDWWPVAIFEGRHDDVSGDIGKPVDEAPPIARCDDCASRWPLSLLKEPRHLEERMDHPPGHPDRIEPAGECPTCGALAYTI